MEKNLAPSLTTSTKTKRSLYRRKLQCQERIIEQSTSCFSTATTLMPPHSTTYIIRRMSPKISSDDSEEIQDMELKSVGKLGMVKRKQFLQKRDISRSHET
ncbi:unnamed protein product [Rotaria sordida]|uniref:Uncharacterized protein n=1 Tax=Rotaria sordida TaxID=392033 RepID=A0A814FMD7_9BILA|nr:unnamed protein product [Rotaria sordida]CAF0945093.1 unnamed protein product [Rotaria sordida]CAF0987611.1 unnamed protein product [Rotaria sordida]CAF1048367.1 unnamed protein product [Rotaria sordida]CAF3762970.1 unnamed protein product [Rotaria sordida]